MSHHFINYDSSGPRPPIPGQEEMRQYKMTDRAQNEPHHSMEPPSSSSSSSPPSCLKWARTLSSLLEDREGVELFKKYVESEEGEIPKYRLEFYFACEGLKQRSDPVEVKKLIGAIYRRYLKKIGLKVPDDIKQALKNGLKDDTFILTSDIYDQLQQDVERIIDATSYNQFLQSEMYIRTVERYRNAIERNHAGLNTTNTTTATSSSISEASSQFISRSSTLPTLHEEGDGPNAEGSDGGAVGGYSEASTCAMGVRSSSSSISSKLPISLTKDALMATQHRRLEMRAPGAPGYSVYNALASYNPVSRRDSELASLSSGRTDSDTMSRSSLSDGRPQHRVRQHHQMSIERRMRDNLAANVDADRIAVIPRTQRSLAPPLPPAEFHQILYQKLKAVETAQKKDDQLRTKLIEVEQKSSEKFLVDAVSAKFFLDDDKDDQDILDDHVSRIWADMTPHRSPGNLSPGNAVFQRRKPHEMVAISAAQSSMRISKSMPDSNMRKNQKWGSINTDSGISLFSSDTMTMKQRDAMSISSSSSSCTTRPRMIVEGTIAANNQMTTQLDDARRSKRHHQPPLPQKNVEPPPLPAKNFIQPPAPIAAPASSTVPEITIVFYSFCDGEVPYLIKIPTKKPTLKQFKDYLPKKGNYRYFFKTKCDDVDNPVIQEEMCNDSDILPMYEGKVMATVKSVN